MMRMRAMMAALAAFWLAATPARAQCPDWLVADMVARSVPAYEIGRMCGPPQTRSFTPTPQRGLGVLGGPSPAPAPAPASDPAEQKQSTTCVPAAGPSCTTRSERPSGSPCWCTRQNGEYEEGTIR